MGAFSFFFSANYGQFDSLVDDGSRELARYRLIPLIAPMAVAAMYLQILLSQAKLPFKIGCGLTCVMIALACYYHAKHLIIPDVDFGIVHSMRSYNALALCLAVLNVEELVAMAVGIEWLLLVSGAGLCVISLALVPMMDKGVKAWRI
jgi:hypothetical protein